MITDLVRDALQRQAELAPDPARVQDALARSGPATRRRWARVVVPALATATLVAGGALAVPRVLLDGPAPPAPTADAARTANPDTPPGTVEPAVPLRYSPGQLPPGLRENERHTFEGVLVRSWVRAAGAYDDSRRLELSLSPGSLSGRGEQLTVAGRPARYVAGADEVYLGWQAEPDLVIGLRHSGLGLGRTDLLAIARSVRADPATFTVPIRVRATPSWSRHVELGAEVVSRSAHGYLLEFADRPKDAVRAVAVSVDPEGPDGVTDGAQRVSVSGRAGWYRPADQNGGGRLVVRLGPGQVLEVEAIGTAGGTVSRAEILRIAESVEIGSPDLSWAR